MEPVVKTSGNCTEEHRAKILLHLKTSKTQDDLRNKLEMDGIKFSKHQVEYRLKQLGCQRSLSAKAWRSIDVGMETRARRTAKDRIAVYRNGDLLHPEKIRKHTRRHVPLVKISGSKSVGTHDFREVLDAYNISIWPSSLPWLQFELLWRNTYGKSTDAMVTPSTSLPQMTSSEPLSPCDLNGFFSHIREIVYTGGERFPSEYNKVEMRVPISLTDGQVAISHHQVLDKLLYMLSNSMLRPYDEYRVLGALERSLHEPIMVKLRHLSDHEDVITTAVVLEKLELRRHSRAPNKSSGPSPDTTHLTERSLSFCDICDEEIESNRRDGIPTLEFHLFLEHHRVDALTLALALHKKKKWVVDYMLDNNHLLQVDIDYRPQLNLKYRRMGQKDVSEKCTALTLAIAHRGPRRRELVESCLQRGAKPDIDAVVATISYREFDLFRLLLDNAAPVSGLDEEGISPLIASLIASNSFYRHAQPNQFTLELTKRGAKSHIARDHPVYGRIPSTLHCCILARWPSIELVDFLIANGSDTDYRYQASHDPDDESWLNKFIKDRLDLPRHGIPNPETPLEYSICVGAADVAFHLLRKDCQLTGREIIFATMRDEYDDDSDSLTSVKMGLEDMGQFVRELLARDPEQAGVEVAHGFNALQAAITRGDFEGLETLSSSGFKFKSQDALLIFEEFLEWYRDGVDRTFSSRLPVSCQMQLVGAMTTLDCYYKGLPALGLLCSVVSPEVVRWILSENPTAYDSAALCAMVNHVGCPGRHESEELQFPDLQEILSRRSAFNQNPTLENTAIAIAIVWEDSRVFKALTLSLGETSYNHTALPSRTIWRALLRKSCEADIFAEDWPYLIYSQSSNQTQEGWPTSLLTAASLITTSSESSVNRRRGEFVEETVDHLLSCGYEPDGWTFLIAIRQGKVKASRGRSKGGRGTSNIFERLDRSRYNIMKQVDRPSWCPTVLQMAAYLDDLEAVQLCLDAAADAGEGDVPASEPLKLTQREHLTGETLLPRTALQYSVENGNREMMRRLIDAGADVNAPAVPDSGATALQIAATHGFLPIANELIDRGADIDAIGSTHGRTALEAAAENGRLDMVCLLLGSGASTEREHSKSYIQSVVYAERKGHGILAGIIRKHRQWTAEDCATYEKLRSV